jgi:polyisoprenyl-phosphate glycosyltransferase
MYAVVLPIYKNEKSLPEVIEALREVFTVIRRDHGQETMATFVVDGSPDNSEAVLRSLLPTCGFPTQLVVHARNFGSFAAIRTGLQQTEADYYGMIAADLQEPPELLTKFVAELVKKEVDIVVGVRASREDPSGSKAAAGAFWGLYRRFVMKEIPAGGVDLFGCTRQVRNELLKLEEANSSLVAQLFWLGFRRAFVTYERRRRKYDKSGWTFRRKAKYLLDSIYAFTDLPIRFITIAGATGMAAALAYGAIVLVARLFGYITDPGFAATIIAITFFGGLNAFAIGIVGAYAWRAFENTKARPLSVVRDRVEFGASDAQRRDQHEAET